MITENLCKCNNCDTIMIDKNPQINAKEYPLTGKYHEMCWDITEKAWVCEVCLTDDYLVDL